MRPISSTKLTGLASSGALKKAKALSDEKMGLKLFERAVRDKEKMDKLFGVPAAKTLSNIGGNRDGCASLLRSQSILLILRQAMHKYVGFGHQIRRFLPHQEILKTFNFLFGGDRRHGHLASCCPLLTAHSLTAEIRWP
jgi:hypothetical protein